jgi:CHAD domain-containing protein
MAQAKLIIHIECGGPASDGMRLALSERFNEMSRFREQALNWEDPEGVHDMRVASRRLRGALRDFMPYVRKRPLADCLREIKAIAKALGEVRDHDVAIPALENIAVKAPPDIAKGILGLATKRRHELEAVRSKLAQALESDRLEKLKEQFELALEAALRPASSKKVATTTNDLTYRDVARRVILQGLEEFESSSKSLYRPHRVKRLHELRITAKHLRYALELFERCWAEESSAASKSSALKSVAQRVAALQTSLGGLHDCDVWIGSFGKMARHALPGGEFDHRATATWLLSHFVKLRGKHLSKALLQWNDWKTSDISAQLHETIQKTQETQVV